mgnify:FL=1
MQVIKKWYANLSLYSAIGMGITFLAVGGYIRLNLPLKLVLLGATITTAMFIVTRILWFKRFGEVR